MARARTAAKPAEKVETPAGPEEERAVVEAAEQPEEEVRAEEFTQGIAEPVWYSPLPDEVVVALRQPLDPNRIRRRKGRGSGQFEYLAGHDVKRRANELFGFGNWGSRLLRLEETAAVEVKGSGENGKPGWHISYMAVVEVTVRDCLPFSDVGYGDGVEYGAAALATARELATKEASTDALKRALTGWGDQFGLILYAKADEKQRIDRDRDAADAQPATRRQEGAGGDPELPQTWAEIKQRLANVLGGGPGAEQAADWWLAEFVSVKYGVVTADLDRAQKRDAFGHLSSLVMLVERDSPELTFTSGAEVRDAIARAAGKPLDGIKLEGPPWRMGPDEEDRPPLDEYTAAHEPEEGQVAASRAADAPLGKTPDITPDQDIEFGPPSGEQGAP